MTPKTFGQKTIAFLIWLFEPEDIYEPDEFVAAATQESVKTEVAPETSAEPGSDVARAPRPAPVTRVLEELSAGPTYTLAVVFTATTAKDPGIQESNEDASAWDEQGNRAAVFDGATESFAAQRWATLLAEHWTSGESDWIAKAQAAYADAMMGIELTWAQEAAAQRGSFATIAEVKGVAGGVELTIVGDSCVFLLEGTRIVRSAPFTEEAQFSSAPLALASAVALTQANEHAMSESLWRLAIAPGAISEVLLATDAVSAWLLGEDREARMGQLLAVSSTEEFRELVHAERAAGRLKADDSTIVRLRVGTSE